MEEKTRGMKERTVEMKLRTREREEGRGKEREEEGNEELKDGRKGKRRAQIMHGRIAERGWKEGKKSLQKDRQK